MGARTHVRGVDGPLWDPREVRAVRRINRWTLAATGIFVLAGALAFAVGATGAGAILALLAMGAFGAGTMAALRSTSVGRKLY